MMTITDENPPPWLPSKPMAARFRTKEMTFDEAMRYLVSGDMVTNDQLIKDGCVLASCDHEAIHPWNHVTRGEEIVDKDEHFKHHPRALLVKLSRFGSIQGCRHMCNARKVSCRADDFPADTKWYLVKCSRGRQAKLNDLRALVTEKVPELAHKAMTFDDAKRWLERGYMVTCKRLIQGGEPTEDYVHTVLATGGHPAITPQNVVLHDSRSIGFDDIVCVSLSSVGRMQEAWRYTVKVEDADIGWWVVKDSRGPEAKGRALNVLMTDEDIEAEDVGEEKSEPIVDIDVSPGVKPVKLTVNMDVSGKKDDEVADSFAKFSEDLKDAIKKDEPQVISTIVDRALEEERKKKLASNIIGADTDKVYRSAYVTWNGLPRKVALEAKVDNVPMNEKVWYSKELNANFVDSKTSIFVWYEAALREAIRQLHNRIDALAKAMKSLTGAKVSVHMTEAEQKYAEELKEEFEKLFDLSNALRMLQVVQAKSEEEKKIVAEKKD